MKKVLALFAMLLLVPFAAVGAQEGASSVVRTITLTEDDINSSFRVTNPARAAWTNVSVDLQSPNVSVVNGTYTIRAPRGAGTTSYDVSAAYSARVENGRIFWTLNSIVVDGQTSVSQAVIDQINANVYASWQSFVRRQVPGVVTNLTISETEMIIEITSRS